jgi:hypothetical protein
VQGRAGKPAATKQKGNMSAQIATKAASGPPTQSALQLQITAKMASFSQF